MRDSVELEWAGIPSVAVVHNSQRTTAEAMARVSGMPGYKFLTVDYPLAPLAIWTTDEIRQVAKELAPQIIDLLTEQ